MKKLFIKLIRFYQKNISAYRPRRCRFFPTCSEYAIDALNEFGAFFGAFFIIFRLLRCNPFFKGGYDPVPKNQHRFKKIIKKFFGGSYGKYF